jgi:hypothetical protein
VLISTLFRRSDVEARSVLFNLFGDYSSAGGKYDHFGDESNLRADDLAMKPFSFPEKTEKAELPMQPQVYGSAW